MSRFGGGSMLDRIGGINVMFLFIVFGRKGIKGYLLAKRSDNEVLKNIESYGKATTWKWKVKRSYSSRIIRKNWGIDETVLV